MSYLNVNDFLNSLLMNLNYAILTRLLLDETSVRNPSGGRSFISTFVCESERTKLALECIQTTSANKAVD